MIPEDALLELATLGLSKEQAACVARMLRRVEDATREEQPADGRTARQKRNARYYEKVASEKRLNASCDKTHKTDEDAIKTPPDSAYKDNHASAPVCSNGSSLRSEPELDNPLPSVGPKVSEKPKRSTGGCLPEDWAPSEKLFAYGRKHGLNDEQSAGIFENMRLWARSNRNRSIARKADWDDAMMGAIRRDAPKILAAQARAGPQKAAKRNPFLADFERELSEKQGHAADWEYHETPVENGKTVDLLGDEYGPAD